MSRKVTMSRPFVLSAIVALAFVCGGCHDKPQALPEARVVDVVRVAAGNAQGDFSYAGEVRPRYETSLGFRVGGKVIERDVEVGALVRRGALLARLDPQDQQLNAQGAQSQLAAAQSDYAQSKAEFERYTDLYAKKFISSLEFERRENAYKAASARVEQARAQLAMTRNQAGYTQLLADHDGVITGLSIEVGQVVAAGQTVMKIARLDDREIAINVPENRLPELGASRQIEISLWADPSRSYHGKVREVSPSADPVTRTYAARISVVDADAAMKLGMTANVYMTAGATNAAIVLPATALFQSAGKPAVWKVDGASGTLQVAPVEVGKYVDDKVLVVSGLAAGDLVVRAGVHKLTATEKVRVREEAFQGAMK
jgi:multidrug efflux system membrane fusion protein